MGAAAVRFFVGLHMLQHAQHFGASFISVNRLKSRHSPFSVGDWIMDSGAFSTILKHGRYPETPAEYAAHIRRWSANGNLLAAVSQDYMCEKPMLERTGLTIAEHQRLTIERYDALLAEDCGGTYIMPVLQGYAPVDYLAHIEQYGDRLKPGMWVGVGSVCKRNADICSVWRVLDRINEVRPDLRLHGFGLKTTSLESSIIRGLLYSADSMAWSFAARREYRNPNDWREALAFVERIAGNVERTSRQLDLIEVAA